MLKLLTLLIVLTIIQDSDGLKNKLRGLAKQIFSSNKTSNPSTAKFPKTTNMSINDGYSSNGHVFFPKKFSLI
uniref:Uncharacterized protein n=1 Tax=Meloidogyne enterolobii TaxID=390850 RepID=A0A6V7UKJ0_MELEN|nr:unnamed protein product [Meloidogyne enterolobii]